MEWRSLRTRMLVNILGAGAVVFAATIGLLNEVAQHNATVSEKLSTNAEELSSQAGHLKELVAYFKVK